LLTGTAQRPVRLVWKLQAARLCAVHRFDVNLGQEKRSPSSKGALRGLRCQLSRNANPSAWSLGAVFDVMVGIRKTSPVFGPWAGVGLTGDTPKKFWVQPSFANGIVMLSESVGFLHQTAYYFAPAHERYIARNDPANGISWPQSTSPELSIKDQAGKALAEEEVFS
jgi:dTDP-4-dehydrorhamnose 3,5-epimerase